MTTQFLVSDIKHDEGLRLEAYPDPVSHGEPWTIGYGSAGPEVHQGLVWTQEQAESALASDIARAERALDSNMPWWRSMCDVRQDVMVNLCFNMGAGRLSGFHQALAAMQAHDYEAAADQLLDSVWARQVGHRAIRLAAQMRTGTRVPTPGDSQ